MGKNFYFATRAFVLLLITLLFLNFLPMEWAKANPTFEFDDAWYERSDGNSYTIENANQLADLARRVNDYNSFEGKIIKLANDIDLGGIDWTPIGSKVNYFKGEFDGGGHKITGLKIANNKSNGYEGLFGAVSGATIKNLRLVDIDIKVSGNEAASDYVGGLLGLGLESTKIENCSSSGIIISDGMFIGGLVGNLESKTLDSVISNCYSSVNVTSDGERVGGLLGDGNRVKIYKCYSTGKVVSSGDIVGGLIGHLASGEINDCYSLSDVIGKNYVGGLLGVISVMHINRCYATGSVEATGEVAGGLVGSFTSTAQGDKILNCVALNEKVIMQGVSKDAIGRVVGTIIGAIGNSVSCSNNYAFNEMELSNRKAKSHLDEKDGEDIDANNLSEVWKEFNDDGDKWIIEYGKLPTLKGDGADSVLGGAENQNNGKYPLHIVPKSEKCDITSFVINGVEGVNSDMDSDADGNIIINIKLPHKYKKDVKSLIPEIKVSDKAEYGIIELANSNSDESENSEAQDFSQDRRYIVNAEYESKYQMYVIKVEFEKASNDATLASYSIEGSTNYKIEDNPNSANPNTDTEHITAYVKDDTTSIIIGATAKDGNATIVGKGEKILANGSVFEIVVTAEDGVTKKTYVITVVKEVADNNNSLGGNGNTGGGAGNNNNSGNSSGGGSVAGNGNSGNTGGGTGNNNNFGNSSGGGSIAGNGNGSGGGGNGITGDGDFGGNETGNGVGTGGTTQNSNSGVRFDDVKASDWFHNNVYLANDKGLMKGVSDTEFAPNLELSRAMVVTILYRLEGSPAVSGTSGYDDVENGQWYSDAITWGRANVIVKGYSDTLFGPADDVTREQFSAIMFRYSDRKNFDVTKSTSLDMFADGNTVSYWAVDSVKWAVAEGLVNGRGGGMLAPVATTTRAEGATILMRFLEKINN